MRCLRSQESWGGSTVCALPLTEGTSLLCGLRTSPASAWKPRFALLIYFSAFLREVPPLSFPLGRFYHVEFDFLRAAPYLLLDSTPALLPGVCKVHLNHIYNKSNPNCSSSLVHFMSLTTFLRHLRTLTPIAAHEERGKKNKIFLLYFYNKKKNWRNVDFWSPACEKVSGSVDWDI